MRHARLISRTCLALTGLFAGGGAALAAVEPGTHTVVTAAVGGPIALLWATLGVVVAARLAGQRVGVLMGLVGVMLAFTTTRETGWLALAEHPEQWGSLSWLVAILSESSVWLFASLALLLLYYPDGALPSSRWRLLAPVLVAACAMRQVWGAFDPAGFRAPLGSMERPFAQAPLPLDAAGFVAFLVFLAAIPLALISLLARYRRAAPLERAQVRWLALAGAGVPGFLLVCIGEVVLTGEPGLLSLGVGVTAAAAMPAAIAAAMLWQGLYDVDATVAVTVKYIAFTVTLVAIFATVTTAGGIILGRDSSVVAAAATAVSAVALSPLRRSLQRAIDRRFYPLRRAAFDAMLALERDTRAGTAGPERLEDVLRTALRVPGLRVVYRLPGTGEIVTGDGARAESDSGGGTPVIVGDRELGRLSTPEGAIPAQLLREVAAAASTLVELVCLRAGLRMAVIELEESRARLVRVGDEERQRLERDLHDGAQQRLVSLGLRLRLAQRHLDDSDHALSETLDGAVAELSTTVAELRQIAHGLRPGRLDDGLRAALTALCQVVPIPIEVAVTPRDVPSSVAMTAYYVVSEAIANAVKHAEATRVGVSVAERDDGIEVCVQDDGLGGAVFKPGSGLAGLRDRVAALGGSLSLETGDGKGTMVRALLPCAS